MNRLDNNQLKVLLVEDSEDDIYLISKALDFENIDLKIISDGVDAYEYLIDSNNDVNVVLLDYKLPSLDGFEIMERLSDKIDNFAVIFLTADTLVETAVQAMKLGAMDFFPKFKDYKTLYDKIVKIYLRYTKILEGKILKEALISSEREYRMMFESIQDIYFEITNLGQIINITPSVGNILGYNRFEMKGSLLSYYFKDKEIFAKIHSKLSSGEQIKNFEIDLIDNKNVEIKCSMNISKIQSKEDENYKYVGTIRDVSTYKKLEEMFFQAQKMDAIGRLSGSVAHDYNNYLQIILVSAQLSLLEENLSNKTKEKLKNIINTTQSASKLTRSLLTLSRKHKFEPVVLDLNDTIRKMYNMITAILDENIELELISPDTTSFVLCDPIHLEQVVINLVVNAKDAMLNGGKLVVAISTVENKILRSFKDLDEGQKLICLSIKDSGTGMDKTTLEKIFDPFFTTKSESKGTGLGLSTVYNILNQNNSIIEVDSEIAKGTEFRVFFPEHSGALSEGIENNSIEYIQTSNKTILLVDNNTDVRITIGEMLLKAGYEVLYSPNCKIAEYTIDNFKGRIDLALIDIMMEDGNGFDLKNYILHEKNDIEVILMSGYGSEKLLQFKDNPGYTEDLLEKPFDLKKFLNKLK
ncbi:MAG: response regulator [Candidatus Delongbacteria bacterium]|nr:response regulator [Candidatus Delongbacteria bacterium]